MSPVAVTPSNVLIFTAPGIAVVNCRADRPDRSIQLAEAAGTWRQVDHYLLTGSATDLFTRVAESHGTPKSTMTTVEGGSTQSIIQAIWQQAGDSAMVMGMGNTAGPGMDLVDYFQRQPSRSRRPEQKRILREAA